MFAQQSLDQALLKAKSHIKKNELKDAQEIYQKILNNFPQNKRAQQGLASLNKPNHNNSLKSPSQDAINQLMSLYNQGQLSLVVQQAKDLTEQYPEAFIIWNILGAAHIGLGQVIEASKAFKTVTILNPNYIDGFNNLGITLKDQGKLDEAIEAYNKCI